jgi:hypothetical protein
MIIFLVASTTTSTNAITSMDNMESQDTSTFENFSIIVDTITSSTTSAPLDTMVTTTNTSRF